VFYQKGDNDRAIADYSDAIRLDPNYSAAYNSRGFVYYARKDFDRALADYNDAIRIDPKNAVAIYNRGSYYFEKQDFDRALADFNEAIRIDPQYAAAYNNRGRLYARRKDYDRAMADYDESIRLDPRDPWSRNNRGLIYRDRQDYGRALSDFDDAIGLDPKNAKAIANRGIAYQGKGDADRATADLNEALRLDPTLGYARTALANIKPESTSRPTSPASISQPSSTQANANANVLPSPSLRRVALIISNSNYAAYGVLPNPKHDGELIASVLRGVGFQSVVVKSDLTRDQMLKALQEFAAAADNADWSVVYYSGHGVAYNGINYMIPVDAKLAADRDIDIEAVDVGKLSSVMAGSSKLRLIVLDMCRSNPFVKQMRRTIASRGIGRGLAPPPEDDAGEYTAFAARDGQEALDGDGNNSPFAEALAKRLQMPNVDVRRVFDYVRDDVLKVTNRQQQPFTYGSLPPVDFFFVQR